jgi:glutamate dehydrogenase/leucine dehydrogenase
MSPPIIPKKLELEIISRKENLHRFSESSDIGPEQEVSLIDPETSRVWGYVVIDNTRRGPGLGGIRIAPDLKLNEVRRLARSMTLKNSAANLPYGGGKSGIVSDPKLLNNSPGLKRDLIGLFAETIFPLDGYVTAPDMGTNENDIQHIHDINSQKLGTKNHSRGGAGRLPKSGGIPIDEWGLTAHSLLATIEAIDRIKPKFSLKGSKVAIQGFGNVGAPIANKLVDAGAVIVGVSDINAGLWKKDGLDIKELNRIRPLDGGLANYSEKYDKNFSKDKLDWLLECPCDILIPAARPDAITARNADRIQCQYIVEGANAPTNKMTEYYLQNRRGITCYSDFIVNVGGVMGCAVELKMGSDESFKIKVLAEGHDGRPFLENLIYNTVSKNVEGVLCRMDECKEDDIIFREHAESLAFERLKNPEIYWV